MAHNDTCYMFTIALQKLVNFYQCILPLKNSSQHDPLKHKYFEMCDFPGTSC